ncbi:MAG TPA: hypothetical protein PLH19_03890 [Anaerolineae bacterium]|nr:hypothetical protein [Anaerolineae bacterium]HQH37663.1 hypothetical protein [Anaerolineae bacterium]
MIEEQKSKGEPRPPLGILACLAAGFEITARHPTTLAVPLLLDVFLWLGPRLSLSPLFVAMERLFRQLFLTENLAALPDAQQTSLLLSQTLNDLAARYNLFSMLTPAPLLGVPALMTSRMTVERPLGPRQEMVIASVLVALLVGVVLPVVGMGLSALYLRSIGRRVIDETEVPLVGSPTFLALWGKFMLFALIVGIIVAMLSMIGLSLAALVGLLSTGLALLVLMSVFSLAMFTVFHLVFAIPGIVQLQHSLFRAIRESILLTRGDFVNVTFLILLMLIISRGFNVVWTLPDPATWANLIGIAGHAFVSTALTATLFVFYQDRLNFLPPTPQTAVVKEAPAIH